MNTLNPTFILDSVAIILQFAVLYLIGKIKTEIAELKVYMHERFELKDKYK